MNPAPDYDVDSASLSSGYARRDLDRSSSRVRTYGNEPFTGIEGAQSTHHAGSKLSGLSDEGIENAKQAAGNVFGSENLKREGLEQERHGEAE